MMKHFIIFVTLLFCASEASEFGQYRYSKYIGLNQQLQSNRLAQNRLMMRKRQMMYYENPTRNIRFPNMYSQYPNIENNRYGLNYQNGYGYNYRRF